MTTEKIQTARHIPLVSANEAKGMDTHSLREHFHHGTLFSKPGTELVYWEQDRTVIGSVMPGKEAVDLGGWDKLRADYFCERRELGILNIGASGAVEVDGERFEMGPLDGLYVPRGSKALRFQSADSAKPAKFYLLSYPAHKATSLKHIPRGSVEPLELGSGKTCNERKLYKVIHPGTLESCQLVMGYTTIAAGSAWNTFPPHTHERRSEVYFYFDMEPETLVVHLMGDPRETRHLIMRNEAAVFSPIWSIHAGAGTGPYSFIWGMGGENQDFTDMDACDLETFM